MSKERPKQDIPTILGRLQKPKKAVVTAGMPYGNGPLHIGHLAGAHLPPDVYSRWLHLLIGKENVLFVSGSDDHGSNSEVSAKKVGKPTREFIAEIHSAQKATLDKYSIGLDIYSGTSQEKYFDEHVDTCQEFLTKLYHNKLLDKKSSMQWYDPSANMFLADRFVQGTCPNPNCENKSAYSDECDECGAQYEPEKLQNPKSAISDGTPELRETKHWFLNMWKLTDQLVEWLKSKEKTWSKPLMNEVMGQVLPSFVFSNTHEPVFKDLRSDLPKHKSRYAPGKKVVVQFESLGDLEAAKKLLQEKGVELQLMDGWAHRSITRDVQWGIPLPSGLDSDLDGKTLYVWPESLIAPISFTKRALQAKGLDPSKYAEYWTDPDCKIYQFLGVDNVYFYVLMQGAMWLGTQEDPYRQPIKGELQLTDIFAQFHLQLNGKKMSKSTGNFYTADDLLDKHQFTADQVRYYLCLLSLFEKTSNFDFTDLERRNDFLAGPMNAAFEKPIAAVHSKFGGKIPDGKLIGKTESETIKIVQTYTRFMEKGQYPRALFAVENYARIINSLFAQFKPHDDRHDLQERSNALFSCFYILKNLVILLYPIVPSTMEKVRKTLNLPESIYSLDELETLPVPGQKINEQVEYFPAAKKTSN